jgi:hypothetical protein
VLFPPKKPNVICAWFRAWPGKPDDPFQQGKLAGEARFVTKEVGASRRGVEIGRYKSRQDRHAKREGVAKEATSQPSAPIGAIGRVHDQGMGPCRHGRVGQEIAADPERIEPKGSEVTRHRRFVAVHVEDSLDAVAAQPGRQDLDRLERRNVSLMRLARVFGMALSHCAFSKASFVDRQSGPLRREVEV